MSRKEKTCPSTKEGLGIVGLVAAVGRVSMGDGKVFLLRTGSEHRR